MKRVLAAFIVVLLTTLVASNVMAAPGCSKDGTTIVQCNHWDQDGNGYPDQGVTVTGHYTSLYAYDANGNWYWDLGDGRVEGTVGSVAALDQSTLTQCDYEVNYRGNFENDPYLNSGWIINTINCSGYDDNGQYNVLIVNQSDPRYTGNPAWAIWGNWEYFVDAESFSGNLVAHLAHPDHAVGN